MHVAAPRNLSAVQEDLHDLARLARAVRALQPKLPKAGLRADRHGDSAEQAAPRCKDPTRLPDPSTVRRWAQRRLLSLWCWAKLGAIGEHALPTPTILAWDLDALCRILLIEARSP
jgi:hypothetical protein